MNPEHEFDCPCDDCETQRALNDEEEFFAGVKKMKFLRALFYEHHGEIIKGGGKTRPLFWTGSQWHFFSLRKLQAEWTAQEIEHAANLARYINPSRLAVVDFSVEEDAVLESTDPTPYAKIYGGFQNENEDQEQRERMRKAGLNA